MDICTACNATNCINCDSFKNTTKVKREGEETEERVIGCDICQEGYYKTLNNLCVICDDNNPYNCANRECSTSKPYEYSKCKEGYFINKQNKTCIPCSTNKCETCDAETGKCRKAERVDLNDENSSQR